MKGVAIGLLGLWLLVCSAQSFTDVRPLQNRGLENLVAFTRLLGYMRYFHPSDAAYTADWESFAVANDRKYRKGHQPRGIGCSA